MGAVHAAGHNAQAEQNPGQADSWPVWNADTAPVILQEYKDFGDWARHYSTVRLSLGTFFLSAATGIIYLRWDDPRRHTAVLAAVVFLIGVALFERFTWLTFKMMNEQSERVNAYRRHFAPGRELLKPRNSWKDVTGMPLGIVFLIAFGVFDLWWANHSAPGSGGRGAAQDSAYGAGGAKRAVRIEAPVKIVGPFGGTAP